MTFLARALLTGTSLAPALIVFAFVRWSENWREASIYLFVVMLALVLCFGLLWWLRDNGPTMPIDVESATSVDKDVAGLLIAYLAPSLPQLRSEHAAILLWSYLGVLALAVARLHLLHTNPLLGVFGYHFFESALQDGTTVLVLTSRSTLIGRERLTVVKVSNDTYLEATA